MEASMWLILLCILLILLGIYCDNMRKDMDNSYLNN